MKGASETWLAGVSLVACLWKLWSLGLLGVGSLVTLSLGSFSRFTDHDPKLGDAIIHVVPGQKGKRHLICIANFDFVI